MHPRGKLGETCPRPRTRPLGVLPTTSPPVPFPPPPSFCALRIYPGHGRRFVSKAGQIVIFISSKTRSLYHQRKKSAKLTWTLVSRRGEERMSFGG